MDTNINRQKNDTKNILYKSHDKRIQNTDE